MSAEAPDMPTEAAVLSAEASPMSAEAAVLSSEAGGAAAEGARNVGAAFSQCWATKAQC